MYLKEPWERPEFLVTAMGFQVAGCRDDSEGRKGFLLGLERNVDWGNLTQAGVVFPRNKGDRNCRCMQR